MNKCIICGKDFEKCTGLPKRGRNVKEESFCSIDCKRKYESSLVKGTKRNTCRICNKEYTTYLSDNRYICEKCNKELQEQKRYIEPHICEVCGKEFNYDWRKDTHTRLHTSCRFCSPYCSKKFSSCHALDKTKILVCPSCNKEYVADIHTKNGSMCKDCAKAKAQERTRKASTYKYIKLNDLCLQYDESSLIGKFVRSGLFIQHSANLKKLGFNFENLNIEEEFYKVKKLLEKEYVEEKNSSDFIEKKYNLYQGVLSTKILNIFGITKRTLSESIINSMEHGIHKFALPKKVSTSQYKQGYHVDWQNKPHYLRSSYEENFAKKLDKQKIIYETESLRIKYFDSQLNYYKIAIPDFYLPETNTIVEIKSKYFYDPINLNDRKIEFTKLGYNFYVYLDNHIELNEFPPINQLYPNDKVRKIPVKLMGKLYKRDKQYLNMNWLEYESFMSKKTMNDLSEEDKRYLLNFS